MTGEGNTGEAPVVERPKSAPDFISRLHRQKVTARIPGQPAINGTLTGYTQYELLITDERGKEHLVFKGAGLILDLPDGWRRVRSPEPEPTNEGET